MNIVKTLQKAARKNYEHDLREAESHLDSVKENLQIEDEKDVEMLKHFGTYEMSVRAITHIASTKQLLESGCVTLDNIRSLCLRYKLRCLPVNLYKKAVPLSALNDLRRFKEENDLSDRVIQANLVIIAPKEHFNLGARPEEDPVLLYRNKNNLYEIVSSWGSDFTPLRRIMGFWSVYGVLVTLIASVFIPTIATCVLLGETHPIFFVLLTLCYGLAVSLVCVFLVEQFDWDFEMVRKDQWNDPYTN